MKVTKEITYPATTQVVDDKLICDLCKTESKSPDRWGGTSSYGISETAVYYKEGASYPDGGSHEMLIIDICPKCFTEKLLKWFADQGVQPRQEESYW